MSDADHDSSSAVPSFALFAIGFAAGLIGMNDVFNGKSLGILNIMLISAGAILAAVGAVSFIRLVQAS
jgi:hypothetical protein